MIRRVLMALVLLLPGLSCVPVASDPPDEELLRQLERDYGPPGHLPEDHCPGVAAQARHGRKP